MSLPASLPGLTTREAITDCVYRCVNAFDTNDLSLLNTSITEDSVLDLNGKIMRGRSAIQAECFDVVAKLDTTHFVTNVRVNIIDCDAPEPSKAAISATTLAQHYRGGQGTKPDATRYLAGAHYYIDAVRDEKDGLWKAKYWKLKVVWTEGDMGVVTGN